MKQAKKANKDLDEDDKAFLEKKRAGTAPLPFPRPRRIVERRDLETIEADANEIDVQRRRLARTWLPRPAERAL